MRSLQIRPQGLRLFLFQGQKLSLIDSQALNRSSAIQRLGACSRVFTCCMTARVCGSHSGLFWEVTPCSLVEDTDFREEHAASIFKVE
jgi:hypothetical protein